MKRTFVRCLSVLLSVLMLCNAVPLAVFAEETSFVPTTPGDVNPNAPTTPTTISARLEEEITYDGKPSPVSDKTGVLALPHGEKTTGLYTSAALESGTYPAKYEYLYSWFYVPVDDIYAAMKYTHEMMTPLGEDMYGWEKIKSEFSTLSDYADYMVKNAKYYEYISSSPYFPDVTYADIMGEYWEKYMGGAKMLAVGCLAILVDQSTQSAVACAFTDYNACITLGGGGCAVKITGDEDRYNSGYVSLRYGSLQETTRLNATVSGIDGTLTYQWYLCDNTTTPATKTAITGATSATFDAPVPFGLDEYALYTCGVTSGNETYYPDDAYRVVRSAAAFHKDLPDFAYSSGHTECTVAAYLSSSGINWLFGNESSAYFSVEYYSAQFESVSINANDIL